MFKKAIFVAALLAAAAPAAAVNFSFTGTLPTAGTVQFFNFSVGAASNVTLRSYSWGGGSNAAGTVISNGGFDPILAVFDLNGGLLVGQQDDAGCCTVTPDLGVYYDTLLTVALAPGNYRASIAVFPNFANGPNLSNGFSGANSFNGRSANWAFDVLNVERASSFVPEPASWAMLIAGFGLTGAAMRRRRSAVAA